MLVVCDATIASSVVNLEDNVDMADALPDIRLSWLASCVCSAVTAAFVLAKDVSVAYVPGREATVLCIEAILSEWPDTVVDRPAISLSFEAMDKDKLVNVPPRSVLVDPRYKCP